MSASVEKVVLFDGVCNLCNGAVQFILQHDRSGEICFAPLQSDWSKERLPEGLRREHKLETLVYWRGGETLIKSRAVLAIANDMRGPMVLLNMFRIFPTSWLNVLYDALAKRRYRWFGKKDQCMVPKPEYLERFKG